MRKLLTERRHNAGTAGFAKIIGFCHRATRSFFNSKGAVAAFKASTLGRSIELLRQDGHER